MTATSRVCNWPSCLTPQQQDGLADDVVQQMRGERTEVRTDLPTQADHGCLVMWSWDDPEEVDSSE